jgi:hypothetical protein
MSIILLPKIGKLFENVVLKIVRRHIEERGLLNARQSDFLTSHSTTHQCMRPIGHDILDLNKYMSTAAAFLYTEKAFDTTWHLGFL